ncbi:MAG: CHASE domain-containing protein [Gallionella sp.]|nr:CHASE domain-containing protein [Gallionella sp.]
MPTITTAQKTTIGIKMELMVYLLLTIAYVVSGKLALMLALPPGYASPIFPPAGIAVAAALIGGKKALPWIFLGSLLLNVWVGYSANQQITTTGFVVAAIIAIASVLQAGIGGWGLRRMIGYTASLNNIRNALRFLLLAPVICLISASLSVSGLWALGLVDAADFATNWASWWFGDTLGVVVVFPLVMIVAGEPLAQWQSRIRSIAVPILLVLLTGLITIYFLQNTAFNTARQIQQDNFDYQAREIALRIEERLTAYEQVLRGVRGLYVASKGVERDEFRDYVATLDLLTHYPGIQGVGFSLIIPPPEKARHIEAVRKEGFPSYTVRPEGERDLYTSIIYLEPFTGRNLSALGYDMYSEAVRRAAMEQARDLDKSVVSDKVRLVQENDQDMQSGFLVYLPVYRNGSSQETVANRRASIIGWVYAPFRMNDLMQGVLGEQIHNIDLEIYDGENETPETLMYDSRSDQSHLGTPLFRSVRHVEIIGHAWTIRLHSLPVFEANIDTGRVTVIRLSGLLMSVLLSLLVWQLASGRARALKLAQDITRELRESGEQLKEAQRMAHTGSWELDIAGNTLTWSDEIYRIFEIDPASFGASYDAFLNVIHPEDRSLVDSAYAESVKTRIPYSIEHRLLFPDGRIKFVHEKGETLYDAEGRAFRSIGTVQDITEQKMTQERIEHMAHYDTLTNLPNRALFYDRLRQALSLAKRNEDGLTLLYMDLDGFKKVNDTQGHHAGDLILIGVAERLSRCVRESDTVSRLGGDEFTIILNGMYKHEDVAGEAEKIIQAISAPFDLEGSETLIGISIGIARYPEEASKEEDLVKRADQAMYEAKLAGKNTFRIGSVD